MYEVTNLFLQLLLVNEALVQDLNIERFVAWNLFPLLGGTCRLNVHPTHVQRLLQGLYEEIYFVLWVWRRFESWETTMVPNIERFVPVVFMTDHYKVELNEGLQNPLFIKKCVHYFVEMPNKFVSALVLLFLQLLPTFLNQGYSRHLSLWRIAIIINLIPALWWAGILMLYLL